MTGELANSERRRARIAGRLTPARVADAAVLVVLALVMVLQDPGRTRFDTKLDLVVDPWGFLARAFSAWDPTAGFGQLQNQAYGYLFPMGPFFGVAHSLGVPPWLTQALWAWLLLATAYLGVRLLCSRLGLPWFAAVVGGLAYALAPRIVTVIGPLSAEALPAALLPFTLLPLTRPGLTARMTALLSAVPVLFMGAANATLTLAVLPVTVVWILCRGDGRWRLLAWWSLFVGMLSAWWIVPLLVQARYSTPFLTFIEAARDTTAGLTPGEVVRGDVHWVAGFVDQGVPWWPAGYQLAGVTVYVVLTLLVAAVGVVGLASPHMPERRASAWSALLGLVVLSAGSSLSPVRQLWWALLDGPLAPFRNVHKFDPALRLPLAIGVAAAVAWLVSLAAARAARRTGAASAAVRAVPVVAVGLLVLSIGAPVVTPGVAAGRTWDAMPDWWRQTAAFLESQGQQGRALVAPGSGFGQYLWGRTIDEPLQPLASSPWAVDNDLPLGSVGSARLLDSISLALRQGRDAPGLASTLARSGITYVVVRNDLDVDRTGAPSRSAVAATLQSSEGFSLVASFGETVSTQSAITSVDFGRDAPRNAIEVYRVVPGLGPVSVTSASDVAVMTGGPESLLPVAAAGALDADTPVVFADDSPPQALSGKVLITDGLLRRDRALGRGDESLSSVLTANEPTRLHRRGTDLVPFANPSFSVATFRGVASVTASTSQSFGDAVAALRLDRQPFAAVDAAPETWWESSVVSGPVGQWWQVDLRRSSDLRGLRITLAQSPLVGDRVTAVTLKAGDRVWDEQVSATGIVGPLRGDDLAAVTSLRITAAAAEGGRGNFGIREVALPGIRPAMPIETAAAPAERGAGSGVVLSAFAPSRQACVLADDQTRCDPTSWRNDANGGVLDRLVRVSSPLSGSLSAAGVVRSGAAAAALFDPLGEGIRARASSWLSSDVRVRPSAAVDGDPTTSWVADLYDAEPWLDLTWQTPRVVTSVKLVVDTEGQDFSDPLAVTIRVGGRSIDAFAGPGALVPLPPTTATRVSVIVRRTTPLVSVDGVTGLVTPVPVAISEVELGGVSDLVYRPDLTTRSGAVCGLGPGLLVDGVQTETQVDTTLGDILRGGEVRIEPCGSSPRVWLLPGTHRMTLTGTSLVNPVRLAVTEPVPPVATRTSEVGTWDASSRTVQVGAGGEALLRVAESANAGWVAMLDGQTLDPVRVDGWQQGWMLPAGAGGLVTLVYAPSRTQQAGMAAGAVLALLALVLGLIAPGRGSRWTPSTRRRTRPLVVVTMAVLTAVLLLGVVGVLAAVPAVVASGRRWAPPAAAGAVAIAALGTALGWAAMTVSAAALAGLLLAWASALRRRGG